MADTAWLRGEDVVALGLYQRSLALKRATLGPGHPAIALTLYVIDRRRVLSANKPPVREADH